MVAPSSVALGSSARPASPVFARRCTGTSDTRQRVVPSDLLIPVGCGANGASDFEDSASFSFFGLGSAAGSAMTGTVLRRDGATTPRSRISMTPPRGRPSPPRLRASSPRVSRVIVTAASAGSSGGRGLPSEELPPGASGSANAPLLSVLPAQSWSSQGTSPRGSAQPSSPHQHAAHGSPMSTIAPMAPLTSSANATVTGGNSQRDSHVCAATNVTVAASAAVTAEMAGGISAAPSASAILSSLPRLASLPALPAMPALTLALPRMRRQKEWFQEESPANVADIPVAGLHTAEEFEAVMMEVSMAAGAAMGSAEGRLVIVDFFAPWCDACKAVYPTVCEIAEKNPDVVFLKFNLADNRDLGKALGVKILPFFHFYRGQPTRLDAVCATIKTYPRLEKFLKKYNA